MKRRVALLGDALLVAACSCALAQPGATAEPAPASGWQYRLTPYLWIATLTGDLGADGVEGSTDSGYSFWALDNLQGYGSLHFAAGAARWGWFADALYVDYGDEFDGALVDTALGVTGEIYEAGGTYTLAAAPGLSVLGGVRAIDLKVSVALTPGADGSARDRWVDPFVGVEYRRSLGEKWYFAVRGDLGGFGVSSDSQTQVVASAGYRFSDRLEAFGGYRYLSAEFRDDVLFDVTAAGPGLGFTWIW